MIRKNEEHNDKELSVSRKKLQLYTGRFRCALFTLTLKKLVKQSDLKLQVLFGCTDQVCISQSNYIVNGSYMLTWSDQHNMFGDYSTALDNNLWLVL